MRCVTFQFVCYINYLLLAGMQRYDAIRLVTDYRIMYMHLLNIYF